MFCPKYDRTIVNFQSLYELLSYIIVPGDQNEHFLDYGYNKQNSKTLHSHYKKRMLNGFSGTFFNCHRIQYESGALQTKFLNIYYFLPSSTDRIEEINRHMGSVNLYQLVSLNIPLRLRKVFSLIREILTIIIQKKKK